eukprot:COSAG01_NODE_17294_length_1162_cov_6.784572_1_plen_139_part_00
MSVRANLLGVGGAQAPARVSASNKRAHLWARERHAPSCCLGSLLRRRLRLHLRYQLCLGQRHGERHMCGADHVVVVFAAAAAAAWRGERIRVAVQHSAPLCHAATRPAAYPWQPPTLDHMYAITQRLLPVQPLLPLAL